jgi:hypothetical protein
MEKIWSQNERTDSFIEKKSFVSQRRKLSVGDGSRKNGLGGSFFYSSLPLKYAPV